MVSFHRALPWIIASAVAGAHVGVLCCLGLAGDPVRPADPGVVAELEVPEGSGADPAPDKGPVPLPARAASVPSPSRAEAAVTKSVAAPALTPAAAPEIASQTPAALGSQEAVPQAGVPASVPDPGAAPNPGAPSVASGGGGQTAGSNGIGNGDGEGSGASVSSGYLSNPAPAYPFLSRLAGEEGVVRLRVEVDTVGIPLRVEIGQGSGHPRLDGAALAAVWRWKFRAARRAGRAVLGWVQVPIRFSLKGT